MSPSDFNWCGDDSNSNSSQVMFVNNYLGQLHPTSVHGNTGGVRPEFLLIR